MGRLSGGVEFLAALVRTAYEEEIRYPAAALAYYAFVSFVPLLLLTFAVTGDRLVAELSRTTPLFLAPQVERLVDRSLATASGRTGAALLSVFVLGWSGVNVVGDFLAVVRRIEDTGPRRLGRRVRDGVVILGGLDVAILAVVATSALFEFPVAGPAFGLGGVVVLWSALTLAFVPVYYVPSDLVPSPRGALPGAAVAALGWTGIHTGVQFYASNAEQYAVYGVLSGVIVILTSLYLAAAVLLTGIIVNARLVRA
jgi:membrane protein